MVDHSSTSVSFSFLHRACKLVVLLCFLHILVTIVFYIRSMDIRFAFTQNQQSNKGSQAKQLNRTEKKEPGIDLTEEPRTTEKKVEEPVKKLEKCPETSPLLKGPLTVEFNISLSLEQIRKDNPDLEPGGRFRPRDCEALQKVAIIIPFRNRSEHLKYWLHYLHPILQRQQLDYGVYVINQDGEESFNRAKLMNVGYAESLKEYDYNCFVFSDVDLVPMDDRNTYSCFSQPRHLSAFVDKHGFRLPYAQIFGGVSAMSKDQYLKINGFPNNYWGWGGEDDDVSNRLKCKGMSISRPNSVTGKYRMIRHQRDKHNESNPRRFKQITNTKETMNQDGINSLSYKVVKVEKFDLFTKITVDPYSDVKMALPLAIMTSRQLMQHKPIVP
ncbi:uncharacterized protein V6R79_022254 [Siganus canaliculatus]